MDVRGIEVSTSIKISSLLLAPSIEVLFGLIFKIRNLFKICHHNALIDAYRSFKLLNKVHIAEKYGVMNEEVGDITVPALFQVINFIAWKPHKDQVRMCFS